MFLSFFYTLLFAFMANAANWPDTNGFQRKPITLQNSACGEFMDFVTGKTLPWAAGESKQNILKNSDDPLDEAKTLPLTTSQLLVLQDGKVIVEWYDSPNFTANNLAYLWSASKSVTATLVARAIQQEMRAPNGEKLSLDTPVNLFFAKSSWEYRKDVEFFKKLKIRHLLNMSAGFDWDESYEAKPNNSSFLPMLYGEGRANMAAWAINK